MARIGCLLMVLSIIVLAIVIVLPVLLADNPSINHLMERMLCGPGEVYSSEPMTSSGGGGITFNLAAFCVRDGTARRDVTSEQTWYGLIGFGAPFVLGLVLFIVGMSRSTSVAVALNAGPMPHTSMRSGPAQAPRATLSDRLQQLDDAYAKRLLTRDEYEAARRSAIDKANS